MSKVAISLLGIKHKDRIKTVNKLLSMGVKWVHYDLMDEIFVLNKAISIEEMQEIVEKTNKHIVDAHFMVKDPEKWIEKSKNFIDYATFHFEALANNDIENIIKKYCKFINIGIAINPETKAEQIEHLLPILNHVLIMSVQPGKGGQQFDQNAIKKIEFIKQKIKQKNLIVSIGVDGGINNITGPIAIKAGANVVVSGSYLVNNQNKKILDAIEGK